MPYGSLPIPFRGRYPRVYMISDPIYGIKGLQLPNGRILRELLFADDTSLFLRGSKTNLDRTLKVLDLFCAASGAKINWKNKAI